MTAGREITPEDIHNTQRLKRYWMQRIPFGAPGSFTQCVREIETHTPMKGEKARGYCATLYHQATGRWPGDHDGIKGNNK